VVLAHRDQAAARRGHGVGVAIAVRRHRLGRRVAGLQIELLVAEVAEPDALRRHQIGRAAIFMNAGAQVEALGRQLPRAAAVLRHQHQPAALGGPVLEPVEPAVRHPQIGEADHPLGQAGGGDRGGPGAVWPRFAHRRPFEPRPGRH
jgi:O-acetyl-ADP-ribose deacetylase (regulator of RNase III)